jgi:hypothetical protein
MSRKPKLKPDDPEQSKRFIETAKEIGADEDPERFEETFRKIGSAPPPKKERSPRDH